MNEEELKKELEQLPNEWLAALAARISTQYLPGLIYKVKSDDPLFACWPIKARPHILLSMLITSAVIESFSKVAAIFRYQTEESYVKTVAHHSVDGHFLWSRCQVPTDCISLF